MPSALHTIEGLQAAEAYRCMSLDDHVSGWAAGGEVIGSLDHALARIDDRETLRPLLAQLPSGDRTILALRFFHQLTQTQIAEQVGVSQMQSRERSAKPWHSSTSACPADGTRSATAARRARRGVDLPGWFRGGCLWSRTAS
jgi:Sigma-70, region 4